MAIMENFERNLQEYGGRKFLRQVDNQWMHTVDNQFAKAFLNKIGQTKTLRRYSYSEALCKRCSNINLSRSFSMSELREKMKPCILCRMQPRLSEEVHDRMQILSIQSPLRVCTTSGSKGAHADIQIGFPVLPKPESSVRFELFCEWLRVCDENHVGCRLEGEVELPTRVVDVEYSGDLNVVRLHSFRPEDRGEYIALSHCWGMLPEKQTRRFCTSRNNIEERHSQGFALTTLPQTFKDAVEVTRKLGKRYLWIDSLCIIQDSDNHEDWERESRRMGKVFRNAYCTIAATSAEDSNRGFLKRPQTQRLEVPYINVQTSSHGSIYVSTVADDFHEDAEKGLLNQRAWVLQERALSRRTIHFTANQSYYECGDGVRCETLGYIRNSKALFLGDPKFPKSLNLRLRRDKISLFQHLFARYSQLGLTKPTDRPLAISGLEQQLAGTLETECRYGVFEKYLHRSLLWQRSGSTRMDKILYTDDSRNVPSWSWMAYSGQIEYVETGFDHIEWNEGVQLRDNMLQAPVRDFQNCSIEPREDGACAVLDEDGDITSGWMKYDEKRRTNLGRLGCVVIGRGRYNDERRYYILIVAPVRSEGTKIFKRVGIGSIPHNFILFRDGEIDEHIL
ncbi:HET-domain-containing protein [Xylariaceae sp. FL1651]|nr:HET-domain-containing protein [Xylariaceae sp. FL1651]